MSFQGVDYFGIADLLTEEERLVQATFRRFVDEEIMPVIGRHFRDGTVDAGWPRRLGALGASLAGGEPGQDEDAQPRGTSRGTAPGCRTVGVIQELHEVPLFRPKRSQTGAADLPCFSWSLVNQILIINFKNQNFPSRTCAFLALFRLTPALSASTALPMLRPRPSSSVLRKL